MTRRDERIETLIKTTTERAEAEFTELFESVGAECRTRLRRFKRSHFLDALNEDPTFKHVQQAMMGVHEYSTYVPHGTYGAECLHKFVDVLPHKVGSDALALLFTGGRGLRGMAPNTVQPCHLLNDCVDVHSAMDAELSWEENAMMTALVAFKILRATRVYDYDYTATKAENFDLGLRLWTEVRDLGVKRPTFCLPSLAPKLENMFGGRVLPAAKFGICHKGGGARPPVPLQYGEEVWTAIHVQWNANAIRGLNGALCPRGKRSFKVWFPRMPLTAIQALHWLCTEPKQPVLTYHPTEDLVQSSVALLYDSVMGNKAVELRERLIGGARREKDRREHTSNGDQRRLDSVLESLSATVDRAWAEKQRKLVLDLEREIAKKTVSSLKPKNGPVARTPNMNYDDKFYSQFKPESVGVHMRVKHTRRAVTRMYTPTPEPVTGGFNIDGIVACSSAIPQGRRQEAFSYLAYASRYINALAHAPLSVLAHYAPESAYLSHGRDTMVMSDGIGKFKYAHPAKDMEQAPVGGSDTVVHARTNVKAEGGDDGSTDVQGTWSEWELDPTANNMVQWVTTPIDAVGELGAVAGKVQKPAIHDLRLQTTVLLTLIRHLAGERTGVNMVMSPIVDTPVHAPTSMVSVARDKRPLIVTQHRLKEVLSGVARDPASKIKTELELAYEEKLDNNRTAEERLADAKERAQEKVDDNNIQLKCVTNRRQRRRRGRCNKKSRNNNNKKKKNKNKNNKRAVTMSESEVVYKNANAEGKLVAIPMPIRVCTLVMATAQHSARASLRMSPALSIIMHAVVATGDELSPFRDAGGFSLLDIMGDDRETKRLLVELTCELASARSAQVNGISTDITQGLMFMSLMAADGDKHHTGKNPLLQENVSEFVGAHDWHEKRVHTLSRVW